MEYQKTINLFDNKTNQTSKFRTENWVEVNDQLRGKDNSSIIKFRSDLFDYSET